MFREAFITCPICFVVQSKPPLAKVLSAHSGYTSWDPMDMNCGLKETRDEGGSKRNGGGVFFWPVRTSPSRRRNA